MFPVICRLEPVRVRVLSREPATVGCSIDTEQSTRVPPNRRHKVLGRSRAILSGDTPAAR